jgi:hypothetical protein
MRSPFARRFLDPRICNSFLDTCAFDPKYAPEHEAASEIRRIAGEFEVSVLIVHSNQKELEHPNTPQDVKRDALGMIFTLATGLTAPEREQKAKIHRILTGNGKPDKYAADAEHVFESGKYGGYFITTDQRILAKREALLAVCAAMIVTPCEWLDIYRGAPDA